MAWPEETIEAVWQKAQIVQNNDKNVFRKDKCGAWIARNHYGNRDSQYRWEIDHANPKGPDDLSNLQPLQWENNVDKSGGTLKCNVTASGTSNTKNN